MHGRDQADFPSVRIVRARARPVARPTQIAGSLARRFRRPCHPGGLNEREHLIRRESIAGDLCAIDDDAQQR